MATGKKVNNDIFNCPICLEVIRSPKSLPCLHTFCEQCISEFICAADRNQEDKLATYQCPVCRTVVTPTNPEVDVSNWASLLPSNFTLTTLMESTNGKEKQECHTCKRRGQSAAGIMWCRDCMEALCQTCSEYHSYSKSSINHKVIEIGNADADMQGVDVNAISQACPVHSSKVVETFCFDHKKLCCVLCLTLHHRKCDNVKAIEEISDEAKKNSPSIKEVINKLHVTIENSITRKQEQIGHFEESLKKSDASARKHVACAKDKLDRLLLSFSKELSLLGDDKRAKLDDELRILTQLLNNVSHLKKVSTVVYDQGTLVQQFIHTENTKVQIINHTLPVISNILSHKNIDVVFAVDSVIEQLELLTEIGSLTTKKVSVTSVTEEADDIGNLNFVEKMLGVRANRFQFELKHNKVITLPSTSTSYTCGAWMTDNIVVCAQNNAHDIISLDTSSGAIKNTYNWYYAKRIAVDRQRNELYVTYMHGNFVKLSFQSQAGVFGQMRNFKSSLIGGLDIFENRLYIIIGNTVRMTSIDNLISPNNMNVCFNVNTDCSNSVLNSLVIDPKTRRLIYTSKDNEIIGTTLEGEQVFCVKDASIEKPSSLAIHSSGIILVGSETGSVHGISSDGKRYWTVLNKCKSIKKLCDVWLDESEHILYLCGNNYLEMYDIVY